MPIKKIFSLLLCIAVATLYGCSNADQSEKEISNREIALQITVSAIQNDVFREFSNSDPLQPPLQKTSYSEIKSLNQQNAALLAHFYQAVLTTLKETD